MGDNFINPVPLGQAGTGEAFILPASRSLHEFLGAVAANRKQAEIDAAAKQRQVAAGNKSYDDNALKILPGQLYGSEMNGLIQQHIDQGAKYRQQGFDIYHPDPTNTSQVKASEGYLRDRATLEQLMNFRKAKDEEFVKLQSELNDPDKVAKYDPDTVKSVADYYSGNPDGKRLQNQFFGKEQAPSLQMAYNDADFSKKYVTPKTVKVKTNDGYSSTEEEHPDLTSIRKQVDTGFQTDPIAQKMLAKNGVDVEYLQGKKDKSGVMKDIDAFYQTKDGKDQLAAKNIEYGSPEYWAGLPAMADKRIESSVANYEKIADKVTHYNASKLENSSDKKTEFAGPNYDLSKHNSARTDKYTALNYAQQLHNSARADAYLELAKNRYHDGKEATSNKAIFAEPDFSTLKISQRNNPSTDKEIKPTYNLSTWSTAWQPVKGEGVAIDVPNYKTIGLDGHLVESRTGNISRLRLMQVGNLPKLPSGTYANDATLANLAVQMKTFIAKHPDATRMSLRGGGTILIPHNKAEINTAYLFSQLPKESVAVMYKDTDIQNGKLANGSQPIMIPAKQIMSKIKANKLKVPEDDFLNLKGNNGESDAFGLF